MKTCTCPNCNASLDPINSDFMFCSYCGTKVMLDDRRETTIIRDEAKIKEAESKVKIEELKTQKEIEENKTALKAMVFCFIAAFCMFLLLILM